AILCLRPVGARLAGEGVFEIAFAGKPGSYRDREQSVECCSLLFIVNGSIVQLFSRRCSFLFSNESAFTAVSRISKPDQPLAISGMKLALLLRSLDSNNKKAEPCHSLWSTSAAPSRARPGSTMRA
ncbi:MULTISPECIES: hypothetical protein, partial [unclassified Pseudomonas]|uniref:hypothetical protein n=1 Tax=unclassified Pseudomonas TaxID=196821 RepID=UPI001CC0DE59